MKTQFFIRKVKFMKKLIAIGVGVILIISLIYYVQLNKSVKFNTEDKSKESTGKYLQEEKICLDFIQQELTSENGGIYTNYIDNDEADELAGGHQILSESEGLIMLYYIKTKDQDSFDVHLGLVEDKMMGDEGVVKWRIKEDAEGLSNSSASIDDLRIIRSLIYAYDLWHEKRYYRTLEKMSSGLLKYNIYEDCLTSYYELQSNYIAQEIELSYIDLLTMKLLVDIDEKWKLPYEHGLEVIENAYISPRLPLYIKSYNIDLKQYSKAETINIIDSLLVVLHLSEVGEVKEETIDWINNQIFQQNGIFSQYNIETGQPVSNIESTAVYAIAARIAKNIGDKALYEEIMKKMLRLQVVDAASPIYGSFGNAGSMQVFSFDNLQALLAF